MSYTQSSSAIRVGQPVDATRGAVGFTSSGFVAKTTLDESPETLSRTRLAVARAKEGDDETVRSALATLPDEQRQDVILRHVVGLSPGEIADRMGRSEGSIHGLHHRGRRALRRELERLDSAPHTHAPGRFRSRVAHA